MKEFRAHNLRWQLVEGETLESRVRREGPLGAEVVLEIATQVARALLAAEKHGLVHRDLKPSNLMLVPNESGKENAPGVKVIDFGLAKAVTDEGELVPPLTVAQLVLVQVRFWRGAL